MTHRRSDGLAARAGLNAAVLIVDTNVQVDVLDDDPDWADWSIGQLRAQSQVHELLINLIIYAELSLAVDSVEALDDAIIGMGPSARCRYRSMPILRNRLIERRYWT